MNNPSTWRAWAQNNQLEVFEPQAWRERRISQGWDTSFRYLGKHILWIHMTLKESPRAHDWRLFFMERRTFIEEANNPLLDNWIEVWSSTRTFPSLDLESRPLFLNYLRDERHHIFRWIGVNTSIFFKAQKELLNGSPIPLAFNDSVIGALNLAAQANLNRQKDLDSARANGQHFESTKCRAWSLRKDEQREIHLSGVLTSHDIHAVANWIQTTCEDDPEYPCRLDHRHLDFQTGLIEKEFSSFLQDLVKNHPEVQLLGAHPQPSLAPDLCDEHNHLQTIDLLKSDLAFLQEKNDALERRVHQEVLRAQQANDAKSDFLNVLNHELRTPLNGVMGMLELLTTTTLDEDQEEFLRVAKESSGRLLGLVNHLLDYAKLDMGEVALSIQEFEVNHLLESTLKDFHTPEQKNINFHFKGLHQPQKVMGDIQKIKDVVLELLTNALKNTSSGSITLSAIRYTDAENELQLKIEITDTGHGIPKDKLNMLFADFTQVDMTTSRRVSGTGIGLSLCRKLTGMMGGRMGVFSEEGQGSRFWFILPLSKVHGHDHPTRSDRHSSRHLQGKHALVVDDNPITRRVMVRELQRLGLEVEVTGNGYAAIDLIRAQPFDLLFLDLFLPEMDGFTLVEQLQHQPQADAPNLPIILGTTRELTPEVLCRCLESGMKGCLAKPLNVERLTAELEKLRVQGDFEADENA